ncbi:hypothetical protein [Vibrio crassostreae]|uniref:hypothetical protein n=1 Tax=Vibrio crassostreae TaxID=246167 RepID=UPI001B316194|nr:hypothetical protein [Vibrio crassostreae]
MTSKVFSLVAQKLSKAEFKEYKNTVNNTLKLFTGRTLGASKLNECAAAMLGAKGSNVMAALHKNKDVEGSVSSYLDVVKEQSDNLEYNPMLKLHLIPMLELELNGEILRFCVDIHSPSSMFMPTDGEDRPVVVSLWVNAPHVDQYTPLQRVYEHIHEGGDYLTDYMSNLDWTYYNPEATVKDFLEGLVGDKEMIVANIKVTTIFKSLFSLDESALKDFDTFEDLEGLLITGLTHMAVELNATLTRNGHKRMFVPSKHFSDRFTITLG